MIELARGLHEKCWLLSIAEKYYGTSRFSHRHKWQSSMMSFFRISTYRPFSNQPLKSAETVSQKDFAMRFHSY